jgi:hypothetical protein
LAFLGAVQLQWSGGALRFLQGSTALFSLHIQGIVVESACFMSWSTVFISALAAPLLVAAVLLLACLAVQAAPVVGAAVRCHSCAARLFTIESHSARRAALAAFISFLTLAYVEVSWQTLSVFDCTTVDGVSYLRDNVQIECGSAEWWRYAAFGVVAILAYVVGIAALLFTLSRRSNAAALFGSAYTALLPSMRWWLVGALVWRLCAVVVLRLLLDHTTAQVVLFTLLIVARITLVFVRPPYHDRRLMQQEAVQGAVALVVLMCGVAFYASSSSISDTGQNALFTLVVLAIAVHAVSVVYFVRVAWIDARLSQQLTAKASQSANAADEEDDNHAFAHEDYISGRSESDTTSVDGVRLAGVGALPSSSDAVSTASAVVGPGERALPPHSARSRAPSGVPLVGRSAGSARGSVSSALHERLLGDDDQGAL